MSCWWQEPIMQQPAPIKFIGPISQENNFNMQEYYVGLEHTRCLVSYMTYIGTKAEILKLEKRDPLVLIFISLHL
jgi:hypothetical protein